jgi:hypothetical protein
VPWGNIYANAASVTNLYGFIGACGTLDQVLNQVLGPDPSNCAGQTGPLPGAGSNSEPAAGTTPGSSSSSNSSTAPSRASTPATGPNSGAGGLSQLLSPLLQGVK